MMKATEQTALETALLDRFHQLYRAEGFPRADLVNIVRRENTGGGRYTELECDAPVQLDDGYLDLAGGFVEMEGLPNGMMAVVLVGQGRLRILELTVYGGDCWDGEERAWRIV
jgi:hypothetical protein